MSIILRLIMLTLITLPTHSFGLFEFFKKWSDFNAHMRSAVMSNNRSSDNVFKKENDDDKDKDGTTKAGKKETATTLKDIKGVVPAEIYDLLDFYKGSDRFTAVGAQRPRGILLVGAPGTGKTSMVRALANEANIPFIFATASEFVELYVGMGALHVRELFQKAKDELASTGAKHAIIFIDEIDAIGSREQFGKSSGGGAQEIRQTINELLTQMDGFKHDNRITVIGATNRADFVDPALKRPGRFDYVIEIPLPNQKVRLEILKHYLHDPRYGRTVDTTVDLEYIAQLTDGLSGAELEGIVNKAILNVARTKRTTISQTDLMPAVEITLRARSFN